MAEQQSLDDIFGSQATSAPISGSQSLDDIFGASKSAQTTQAAPSQDLMSRTGADVSQRIQNLQNIQNQVDTGKISAPSGFLQRMGQVAGAGVLDPTTELAKSASSYVPDAIPNTIRGAASYLPGMKSYQGSINNYAQNAAPIINNFKKEHPEISGDVEAGVNLAGIIPAGEGIQAAGAMGRSAINYASEKEINPFSVIGNMGAKGAAKIAASDAMTVPEDHIEKFWSKPGKVTPEMAQQVRDDNYSFAGKSGAALDPSIRDNFLDDAKARLWGKSAEAQAAPVTDVAQKYLANLEKLRGQPLTLNGVGDINKYINSVQKFGPDMKTYTPEYANLLNIKGALNDAVSNAPETARISGTPAAWQAYQDANKAHSIYKVLSGVNGLMENSAPMAQPANALKTATKNWAKKGANINSLEDDEVDQLKNSYRTDMSVKGNLLGAAASRVTSGAAGLAGAAAGLAGGQGVEAAITGASAAGAAAMGSKFARNAAFARQLSKLEDFTNSIGSKLPKSPTPEAPQSRALVPVGPVVNHMTEEQIAHARAVNDALGRRGSETPQAGGPLRPQINEPGTLTNPLQGAPIDPDIMSGMEELPTPQGSHENPLLNNPYWAPKKREGGKVGFNLKKFKK